MNSHSGGFWKCCLCAALVALMTPCVEAEQLAIKSYTTADGLAQNSVNRIVRDSHGFLWFCTSEGLSRFDGYTFTNYGTEHGLPHRIVSDLLETRDGRYFVSTYGGLARFDPKGTPAFAAVASVDNENSPNPVSVVRQGHDGAIWAGTARGVYRLESSGGRLALHSVDLGMHALRPIAVEDLIEDHRGALWVATSNGLYRRTKSGTTAHFTKRDGLPDEFLHSLLEDSHGRLWVATRHAGFFRLDTTGGHTPRVVEKLIYTAPDGQPTTWIYEMIETSDGTLWAATDRGLLQLSGHDLRGFSTRNGLTQHEVTALAEDVAGNLWLGTSSAGAMKLVRDGFVSYGERDGLLGVNAAFGDREGGIYFRGYVLGTAQGSLFEGVKLDPLRSFDVYLARFGRFDGDHITWLIPMAIDPHDIGWVGENVTLRARSGEWWIGTGAGLFRFPAVRFEQLRNAQPIAVYSMPQVYRVFEDSRGDIWISTTTTETNALARWDHTTQTIEPVPGIDGLPLNDLARSFGEDAAGNIWIGFGKGLVRYRDRRFALFTTKDGLPAGGINAIHCDHSGRLWLATAASGIVRIEKPEVAHPEFRRYTTAEGLSSNLAEVLTEDGSGRIYVGTGRALDRLDPATGRFLRFTTADGLAPGRFLSAFFDRKGRLWFGTEKGLTRYVPGREVSPAPPNILLSGVTVAGSRRMVSALGEQVVALPELPPDRNQLQFDFVALNFTLGQSLRYQYKLERGRPAAWSAPADQHTINYANLSPARYTFSVRAVNSDGIVSPRPAIVTFTILPHIWQRWWFVSLVIVAIALVTYAAYSHRVRRLIQVANIRASIAADLHDDIGANLTRIAILSEVARRQLGADEEEGPLPSIARISRESVAAMSDIVWAINPDRDTMVDLVRRMRRHAEDLFASTSIALTFSASEADQSIKLGPVIRRDLFLIFKEAVNNAARHARCSRVEIALSVDGQWLLLTVRDNGIGFDPSADSAGQGLSGMRRRAQRLGGSLEIVSRAGAGTTVSLRMPSRSARWPIATLPDHVGDSAALRR